MTRNVLLAAIVLALAFIGWRALTLGAANFHARAEPAAALQWRPALSAATLRAFEIGDAATYDRASQGIAAREAIRRDPLDGRGYWWLARIAQASGNAAEAERLYRLSAQRGPRNVRVLGWLIDRELKRQDYRRAFTHIDQLLRVQPELASRVRPAMFHLAAETKAQADYAAVLARHPPWRSDLMPMLISQSPSVRPLFPLIEGLRQSPGGLTDDELTQWIDRLGREGDWGAAYMTWTSTLAPEQSSRIGNVFNGSFESEPSQSGFDWRFEPIPGAYVSRVEGVHGAGGRFALRVEFQDRRVPFQNVRQLLALAPGTYRLSGRVELDSLRTERGLVWTLTCAEDGRTIGETEPVSGRMAWRSFQVQFQVPAEKCGGQWLTLRLPARIAAEQRIGGTATFDELKIKSVSN